jgi:hypothetical protein
MDGWKEKWWMGVSGRMDRCMTPICMDGIDGWMVDGW